MYPLIAQEAPATESGRADLISPMIRNGEGELAPCDWGTALERLARGLRMDAGEAGWLASGGLTNEELGFFAALAREGLEFRMGGAEAASSLCGGGHLVPEEGEVVIAIGTEGESWSFPFRQRLACNRRQPKAHLIGSGGTREEAGSLRSHGARPGSLSSLARGLANIVIASGWVEDAFVADNSTGFAQMVEMVAPYSTDRVCEETGMDGEQIWELAEAIGTGKRVGFCGDPARLRSEGEALAGDLRNLCLLRGSIDGPGMGVEFGHCSANTRGAQKFGGGNPGEALPALEEAARAGKLKTLWLVATDGFFDPAMTARIRRLAERAEFLAVQSDGPSGPWRKAADLFLPSCGWRGKEGTLLDAAGTAHLLKRQERWTVNALSDFRIFQLAAQYAGCGQRFSRWSGPEAAYQLLRATRGDEDGTAQPEDYAALDHRRPAGATERRREERKYEFLISNE